MASVVCMHTSPGLLANQTKDSPRSSWSAFLWRPALKARGKQRGWSPVAGSPVALAISGQVLAREAE